MNDKEKEAVKSEFIKPLVSAVVGGIFSGALFMSQLHTDIAVLQTKIEAMKTLSVDVKELTRTISYYHGGRNKL